MTQTPRAALTRAAPWIAAATEEGVRYAALELRMAMELISYGKLRAAADTIPPEVLDKYQANQAMRALFEYQDLVAESFTVDIAEPVADGAMPTTWHRLGEHTALTLAWLRTNYSKVGELLHAPPARDPKPMDVPRKCAYLGDVFATLDAADRSTIKDVTYRSGWSFTCDCGKPVSRNLDRMRQGDTAVCSACEAEYRLTNVDDDSPTVVALVVRFPCRDCGASTPIGRRKVKVGLRFPCASCAAERKVTGLAERWQYE